MTDVLNWISEAWSYLTGNFVPIVVFGYAIAAALEAGHKAFPTIIPKRFGEYLSESLDYVTKFVPNVKKKPGTKLTPDGVHPKVGDGSQG